MSRFTEDVILTGKHVVLEPMQLEHANELASVVKDGELWKLWYTLVPAPDEMVDWIKRALYHKENVSQMPFIVRKIDDGVKGDIIGATRFLNIEAKNRRLEIGSTFYAAKYQRTCVNTESKLLLLAYAFETLDCIAVEFRTHYMNQRSRNAILRLGAKQDGILRNHMIMPNGTYRDTVCFSIVESEWPTVKINLQHKLNQNQKARSSKSEQEEWQLEQINEGLADLKSGNLATNEQLNILKNYGFSG